jgi:hypothetical protein
MKLEIVATSPFWSGQDKSRMALTSLMEFHLEKQIVAPDARTVKLYKRNAIAGQAQR